MKISVGDRFTHTADQSEWTVREDMYFGKVDLFCEEDCRFMEVTKKELRNPEQWEKIPLTSCDTCGRTVPADEIGRSEQYGIETYSCVKCSEESKP